MTQKKSPLLPWVLSALLLTLMGCSGERAAADRVPGRTEPAVPPASPAAAAFTPSPVAQLARDQQGLSITKYPGNYTCFKFETAGGLVIITDPYNMDEIVQADIVTTSHKDADHADFSHLQGQYRLVDTTGTFSLPGITITGVAGHHNRDDATTSNIIYVFDLGGLRLAQFASQGERPSEAMYAAMGKADILIIQVYGAENKKLDVGEAAQIARRLEAGIVIPAHTDTSQNDRLAFLLMGGKSEKVDTGRLFVSPASLAAQTAPRVVVLDVP